MEYIEINRNSKFIEFLNQTFVGKEQYQKFIMEEENRSGSTSHSASCKLQSLVRAFEEAGKTDSPISIDFLLQQCLRIIFHRISEGKGKPISEKDETFISIVKDLWSRMFSEQLKIICNILWTDIARPYDCWKFYSLVMLSHVQYGSLLSSSVNADPKLKSLSKRVLDELDEIRAYEEFKSYSSFPLKCLKDYIEKYETVDAIIGSAYNDKCPVCLDSEFKSSPSFMVLENCNHLICPGCYINLENARFKKCPLCRQSFKNPFSSSHFQRMKIMSDVFKEGRNKPYFQNLFKNKPFRV